MNISFQQAKKLLSGNHTFTQLGFSMMLTRLKGLYMKDPSQATLEKCTDEINAFLTKFSTIMKSDYEIISKL